MKAPSASPALRQTQYGASVGTSPKSDNKTTLANPIMHVVFGGGRRGLGALLRSAF